MEKTFSMFSAPTSRNMPQGLRFGKPEREPVNLAEKYRPQRFDDLFGQGYAVETLRRFADNPYPTAFVFSGETGTGKTSAALALANELGVDPNWSLDRIKAGEMDAESVASACKNLRFSAPNGGWKLIVCDEADSMSAKAKQMWLSILEELPARSIVVFTTNHKSKFEQRFLDRCECVAFESKAETLFQDARRFLDTMWTAEGMPGTSPDVRSLPELVEQGHISFRRIVRYVESAKRRLPIEPVKTVASEQPSVACVASPAVEPEIDRPGNTDSLVDLLDASKPARKATANVLTQGANTDAIDWVDVARRYVAGESQKDMAAELGVSYGCIWARCKKMGAVRTNA